MVDKQRILEELKVFSLTTGGLGSWLTEETDDEVFTALREHFPDLVLGGGAAHPARSRVQMAGRELGRRALQS